MDTIPENKLAELIDEMPDEELSLMVFYGVAEKANNIKNWNDLVADLDGYEETFMEDAFTKVYDTVLLLNQSQRAIFMVMHLKSEVASGGYSQLYVNKGRIFTKHIPESLRLIGAEKIAKLTEKTNAACEKGEYAKVMAYFDPNESILDYPLEQFDEIFHNLNEKEENLDKLMARYIRQHKQEFIDELNNVKRSNKNSMFFSKLYGAILKFLRLS